MGLLFFLGVVVLVLVLIFKDRKPKQTIPAEPQGVWRQQYDAGWAGFIAGYRKDAKSKAEKQLIDKMLGDLAAQGFPVPQQDYAPAYPWQGSPYAPDQQPASEPSLAASVPAPQQSASVQLDNASLLLYFGAFLFVASVGLFVAFGGFPGIVRTFAVALVAAVMYAGGIWIFRNRANLEQAGLAFAGIGIATTPFVGLAAYGFVFNRSSGALIWFATSLLCVGLYAHALFTLKKPLLNYILILTFVSLVLSSISAVDAPIYYFGWGLAALGIALSVFGRKHGFDKAFQDASSASAQVFLPLAVLTSLLMVGGQGTGQLGVSLLLAAFYYATEFKYSKTSARVMNAAASQVAATIAVGAITYAIRPELWLAATAVIGFTALQTAALLLRASQSELWTNFGSILLSSGAVAVFLCIDEPGVLLISLLALVVNSVVVWLKQSRTDAYSLAVIAWMVAPVIAGQLYLEPSLTVAGQAFLSLGALLLQWLVLVLKRDISEHNWQATTKVLYTLSGASVLFAAYVASPLVCMAVALVIAASMVVLAERHKDAEWATVAGFVVALPVVRNAQEYGWFAASIVTALVINISVALRYRPEAIRWLGSGLWLLLPISLGNGLLGHWTAAQFGWAYMIVLAGFVFARAIARGAIFVSGKVPLASYGKTASVSYVFGYGLAALIALLSTLFSDHSQLHTSLVLAALGLVTWLLAAKIERQVSLYVLLPVVAQALLLSVIRPDVNSGAFGGYLVASSVLAAFGYLAFLKQEAESKSGDRTYAIQMGSLFAAVITPVSFVFVGETHLMMPVGLLVFTAMLYHRVRLRGQENREWVGALGLVGVWWLMWFFGVRNPQAYTHVLAALFAAYAYWRHIRQEDKVSDQYLYAMLATATVPLILQALGGTAGSLYGWWLLLEQVFFMLLGMSIGKKFVTTWGLYVAVGAVIYQLRGLGWAALTVLAVFLIGLAVYRLQKQGKK